MKILFLILSFYSFGQTEYYKTVYFDNNSSTLNRNSLLSIDSILTNCTSDNEYSIILSGHTDEIGSFDYNKTLSDKRISSVINYLSSKNIDLNKVSTESFGETKPFTTNQNESNRAKNRRVEILVIFKKPEEKIEEVIPQKENWPGENAILVKYGTYQYDIPGNNSESIEIEVLTNTSQMEDGNFSTYTVDGQVLTSNMVFCIRPLGKTPCDFKKPIKIYLPVNASIYCAVPDVALFDEVKDSTSKSSTTWKETDPTFTTEIRDGQVYFVFTMKSICSPNRCKNLDCKQSPVIVKTINIKLKGRRYKLKQVDVIYEDARAILPAKQDSKNKWKAEVLTLPNVKSPTIKLRIKKGKKETFKRIKLNTIKKDKKGNYIISKKQVKF